MTTQNPGVISFPTEPSALIFEYTLVCQWSRILDVILSSGLQRDSDPIFDQAVQTFVQAFTLEMPDVIEISQNLKTESGQNNTFQFFYSSVQAEIAERIMLFHVAERISLSGAQFRDLVRRSLFYWRDNQKKAIGIARLLPDDPLCAEFLRTTNNVSEQCISGTAVKEKQITESADGQLSGVRSLFRSAQEKEFFRSVSAAYPQHLVCANVSLNAVIELDWIRHLLTGSEVRFFYKALLDCVVFDRKNDYVPVLAFELDSPLHDDALQRERDEKKDRILSVAGLRLIRIRPDRAKLDAKDFLALLRNANLGPEIKNH